MYNAIRAIAPDGDEVSVAFEYPKDDSDALAILLHILQGRELVTKNDNRVITKFSHRMWTISGLVGNYWEELGQKVTT